MYLYIYVRIYIAGSPDLGLEKAEVSQKTKLKHNLGICF